MNVRNTCTFPPNDRHIIQNDEDEVAVLKCCVENESATFTWWYNADNGPLSITTMTSYFKTDADYIVFLCGEKVTNSSMNIHRITTFHLKGKGYYYNISVDAETDGVHRQLDNVTVNLQCKTFAVNISVVSPVNITSTMSTTSRANSQDKDSSSNCV